MKADLVKVDLFLFPLMITSEKKKLTRQDILQEEVNRVTENINVNNCRRSKMAKICKSGRRSTGNRQQA